MDYLDPHKEFWNRILLLVGYVLVGLAILIAALILKYQADGFGIDRKGAVIQSGLTFFSSQPNPADIYVNGELKSVKTNTRLPLPAGIYDITLARTGYHDWQRKIELDGGSVRRYDYPFLFPKSLATKKVQDYSSAPALMTQSPDHRWLLINVPGNFNNFNLYDLKDVDKAALSINLPSGLLTEAASSQSWQLVEWADNNRHVLLNHIHDGKNEYILLDRSAPEQSVNLSKTLPIATASLALNDKKFDKYYLYDTTARSLQTSTLRSPQAVPVLTNVLAYKSYGDDTILYATDKNAASGKVKIRMKVGSQNYDIRNLSANSAYLLDLAKYSGSMYVVAGATNDNRVYIFKDPVGQLEAQPDNIAVPVHVLSIDKVNYLSFSASAQFIVAQNGRTYGVYDLENKSRYRYDSLLALDAPQIHASWMDGNRLLNVNGGKLTVFDYDYQNIRTLMPASSSYLPAFTPDYEFVYVLSPLGTGLFELTQTSLLAEADR